MRTSKAASRVALVLAASLGFTSPAWAVYNQKLIVDTGAGQEVPGSSLVFELPDGTTAPVEEDDDGSLVIVFPDDRAEPGVLVVRLPGQPERRIATPAVPRGSDLVVDLPGNTARAVPRSPAGPRDRAGSPPGVTLRLFGGLRDSFVPSIGAGTLIFDNGEDFAAVTDDRIDGPTGGGTASFPLLGGTATIGGHHFSGDTSASNSTAPGGTTDVGIVGIDFFPSGSTGLFLGNAGLDTRADVEQDETLIFLRYAFDQAFASDSLRPFVGLGYESRKTTMMASVTSPSFPGDIFADYSQRLDSDNALASVGLEYDGAGSGNTIFLRASGEVGVVFNNDDLSASQSVVCNLCGPPDEAFTISVSDDRSPTSVLLRGSAGIGVNLGGPVRLFVDGGVEHRGKVAGIVNPRTGDDLFVRNQPAAIGYRSGTAYYGVVGLEIVLD